MRATAIAFFLVIALCFVPNIQAESDIKSFDIQGFKLGMSYDEAIKIMKPFLKQNFNHQDSNYIEWELSFRDTDSGQHSNITFSKKKYGDGAVNISYNKYFTPKMSFQEYLEIRSQLGKKYGIDLKNIDFKNVELFYSYKSKGWDGIEIIRDRKDLIFHLTYGDCKVDKTEGCLDINLRNDSLRLELKDPRPERKWKEEQKQKNRKVTF
jgi:hypothetical protein